MTLRYQTKYERLAFPFLLYLKLSVRAFLLLCKSLFDVFTAALLGSRLSMCSAVLITSFNMVSLIKLGVLYLRDSINTEYVSRNSGQT